MIHQTTNNWNYDSTSPNGWIGGKFDVPNQSTGYHGILKQWWDYYKPEKSNWLLVTEKNVVKPFFKSMYPHDIFSTLEYYADEAEADYRVNLCDRNLADNLPKFDVVVCQATLEHIHDPFTAIVNLTNLLTTNGIVLTHTHTPGFPYHAYPRDYIRYFPDWFIDLPKFIPDIELLELFDENNHIFSVIKKV